MNSKEAALELARQAYSSNRIFNQEEFDTDFGTFIATRRLIVKFLKSGQLNERLLINNTILCLNIFGKSAVNEVYRLLLDDVQFSVIKAILMFLHQYDFSISIEVSPNRILVDVLRDISHRYNLSHL
jgi:hypothetical protein